MAASISVGIHFRDCGDSPIKVTHCDSDGRRLAFVDIGQATLYVYENNMDALRDMMQKLEKLFQKEEPSVLLANGD